MCFLCVLLSPGVCLWHDATIRGAGTTRYTGNPSLYLLAGSRGFPAAPGPGAELKKRQVISGLVHLERAMDSALTKADRISYAMSKYSAASAAELRRTVALRRLPVDQFHKTPEPLLLILMQDDTTNVWSAKVDGQRRMKAAAEELATCHKAAMQIAAIMVKAGLGPDNAAVWHSWDVGRDAGSAPPPPPPTPVAAGSAAGAADEGASHSVSSGYDDLCAPPLGAPICPGWLHTATKKSAAEALLAGKVSGTFLVRVAKSKKRTPNEYVDQGAVCTACTACAAGAVCTACAAGAVCAVYASMLYLCL